MAPARPLFLSAHLAIVLLVSPLSLHQNSAFAAPLAATTSGEIPDNSRSTVADATPDVQIADALSRATPIKTLSELAPALMDANPYVRAHSLFSLFDMGLQIDQAYVPLLIKAAKDPVVRVRATATWLLLHSTNDALIIPTLQRQLSDPDLRMRCLATTELLRRGHAPSESHLLEVLNGRRHGANMNLPIDIDSTVNTWYEDEYLFPLLAPYATHAIFAILMRNPPNIAPYDAMKDSFPQAGTMFPNLGASLRKHPESAFMLLQANDMVSEGNYIRQHEFAREVFRFAGKKMLPVLHHALKSSDPLVRANAASACEVIGDSSSIKPLIRALELRSNLSNMAIVAALGKLKAQAALPYLAPFYIQARLDDVDFRGSGTRPSYKNVLKRRTQQRDVTLRDDWLELKPILNAILSINPKDARSFGHVLGNVKDASLRRGAAFALSSLWPYDTPERKPIDMALLQGLLLDEDEEVRMGAAAGLLGLGDKTQQPIVLGWLQSPDEKVQKHILNSLGILNTIQLAFANPQIQALANNANASDSIRTLAQNLLNNRLNG